MSKSPNTTWMVSELYWPEETGVGHYVTGTAEGLARLAEVRVVCGQPTYSMRGIKAPKREQRNGASIFRVWSTTLNKDTAFGRIANALTLTTTLTLAVLLRARRGDRIITVTNPATLPYVIAAACRLRRLEYHIIVYDIFPHQLIGAGAIDEDSRIARIAPFMNRWLYRGAVSIAVVGRDLQNRVRPLVEDVDTRVGVVTVWADVDQVRALDRNESALLEQHSLKDRFVIQYAGNMGPLQDLPLIVDAMEKLVHHPNIHLLAFGDGRLRRWTEDEVKRRGLTNITICDPVDRSRSEQVHQACDVAIVSLVKGMTGAAVPSRLYNFMAAGKPIVAAVDPESEVARVVSESDIGWVVGTENPSALADAFLDAASNPERVRVMGREARRIAETEYSQERTVQALAALMAGDE
jgi:colanic acid biosynthesis glycosyl transferase WcaI